MCFAKRVSDEQTGQFMLSETTIHIICTMKILLRIILLAVATVSLTAQAQLQVQDTLNFGTVVPKGGLSETSKITGTLVLKNIGTDTLDVKEVRPSCGCTSAPLKQNILPPGVQTEVTVSINLPTMNGPFTKYLTVVSSDPYKSTRSVALVANIQRAVQLSSSYIGFNKAIVGLETDGVVTITNMSNDVLNITSMTGSDGLLVLTTIPAAIKPNESLEVHVRYIPTKAGVFNVDVNIATSNADNALLELKGYGMAEVKK